MKKLLSIALLGIVALSACKKSDNTNSEPVVNNINELTVPEGFNWQNSHDVSVTVNITDDRFGSANHSVLIYDGDPYNGGNLLAKGSASTTTSYQNTLHISNQLSEVYVVKTSPDNSKIISKMNISGSQSSISFSDIDPTAVKKPAGNAYGKTTVIDCNSGCTNTITSTTNNVNVNSGDVLCITGNNITVSFSNVNGTVRVCGSNVTLQNLNLNGSAALLVSSSGSVTMSSLNFNSSSASLQNEGSITISGTSSIQGSFTNSGTYSCSGDFNINSNTTSFTNNGTMNVSGSFNAGSNSGVSVNNNGTINVSGNFQQTSSSTFTNSCSLLVTGNYNQSGPVANYKYIQVGGLTNLNSGELGMYNGAMLNTVNFGANVLMKGYGSTSLVKITGSINYMNGSSGFDGNLQVCTNATVSSSKLTGGAALGCSLYIAQDGCNTVGNGTPAVTDTDGDGVPDNTDDYPNDPTKAYDNYYPSNTGMATVAFEDQWPSMGDYDLNDLVMSYQYKIVTNASNNVVQVNGTYKLWATGGSYGNGFGVEFPISRSSVSGLTFGTLEDNQSKAVVTLFNSMRDQMTNWNTESGAAYSTPVDYAFSFDVANGPSISTFGLSSYNPFIWNASDSRGKETHLYGKTPTDLANTNLFGTSDDNSSISNSRYYVTTTGLPWAIEIPASSFDYPYERVDITQAYLHFASWVSSGGTSYTDWYSNTASGYRNNANIYSH